MLCKKKSNLWFIVIFAMLVALGVFNKTHGAEKNCLPTEANLVNTGLKGASHEHNQQ